MIIATVNAKGGVGKTTTSVFLAAAFHEKNRPVTVIDLDPQGSASAWYDYAQDTDTPLPFEVIDTNTNRFPRVIAQLTASNPDHVVIIDTPPGDGSAMDAAITAADFVVVPTQPSGLDVAQTWKTLEPLIDTPHGVLLVRTLKNTRNLNDVRDVLTQANASVFETQIPNREAIKRSFGSYPESLCGYEQVANEIEEVLTCP